MRHMWPLVDARRERPLPVRMAAAGRGADSISCPAGPACSCRRQQTAALDRSVHPGHVEAVLICSSRRCCPVSACSQHDTGQGPGRPQLLQGGPHALSFALHSWVPTCIGEPTKSCKK